MIAFSLARSATIAASTGPKVRRNHDCWRAPPPGGASTADGSRSNPGGVGGAGGVGAGGGADGAGSHSVRGSIKSIVAAPQAVSPGLTQIFGGAESSRTGDG